MPITPDNAIHNYNRQITRAAAVERPEETELINAPHEELSRRFELGLLYGATVYGNAESLRRLYRADSTEVADLRTAINTRGASLDWERTWKSKVEAITGPAEIVYNWYTFDAGQLPVYIWPWMPGYLLIECQDPASVDSQKFHDLFYPLHERGGGFCFAYGMRVVIPDYPARTETPYRIGGNAFKIGGLNRLMRSRSAPGLPARNALIFNIEYQFGMVV